MKNFKNYEKNTFCWEEAKKAFHSGNQLETACTGFRLVDLARQANEMKMCSIINCFLPVS